MSRSDLNVLDDWRGYGTEGRFEPVPQERGPYTPNILETFLAGWGPIFKPDNPACAGQRDLMIPSKPGQAERARALCNACPDLDACRRHVASSQGDWAGPGMWGGLTKQDRARMSEADRRKLAE